MPQDIRQVDAGEHELMNTGAIGRAFWALALLLAGGAATAGTVAAPRVLVVVPHSADSEFRLADLARAMEVFEGLRFPVDLASENGNAASPDVNSTDAPTARWLADPGHAARLEQLRVAGELKASDYRGILFVGGAAALRDFVLPGVEHLTEKDAAAEGQRFADRAASNDLARLAAAIYDAGGVVGTIGQGAAVLLDTQLESGVPILFGRTVTAATDEEEGASKWSRQLPFSLESLLRERGITWNETLPEQPNVIVSKRLVTGQNAASAYGVAQFMAKLLRDEKPQSGPGLR